MKDTNLNNTIKDSVDLIVFAGQSNMSGRGTAADAVVCDKNAGFEFKAVSNPATLMPIAEPFGLNEDKAGAITDANEDGTTKRSGSMVSALVDEYHKLTGRQIIAVSASVGGTTSFQWKNIYINDAAERLDAAKEFLKKAGVGIDRIFIVWCQGESDGDADTTPEIYIKNTKDIFTIFKKHGAEKCFLIQIGHYNFVDYTRRADGFSGAEWDRKYDTIRKAQADLCSLEEDFIFAGSFEPYIGEMKDQYHYYQTAYNAVGKKAGERMAKFVQPMVSP